MYSVGGMLMQRKHTLCVPPSELTLKDIESAADPDKCLLKGEYDEQEESVIFFSPKYLNR